MPVVFSKCNQEQPLTITCKSIWLKGTRSIPVLNTHSQELKTGIQRDISLPVFTAALFTTARGENKQNKQNDV